MQVSWISLDCLGLGIGGDEGDRTPGLGVANAALSQLSYIPKPVTDRRKTRGSIYYCVGECQELVDNSGLDKFDATSVYSPTILVVTAPKFPDCGRKILSYRIFEKLISQEQNHGKN
jgi:hypothetical protein